MTSLMNGNPSFVFVTQLIFPPLNKCQIYQFLFSSSMSCDAPESRHAKRDAVEKLKMIIFDHYKFSNESCNEKTQPCRKIYT